MGPAFSPTFSSRLKALAKNLAALGVGCVVAAVLLEGALRIHNPFEIRVRGNEIVLPAHRRYVFREQHVEGLDETIVHSKNSLGFRGPEPPPEGIGGTLGIIAVGGSTTECFYLSDRKTWPELLQSRLDLTLRQVWINNAGLNGHTTFGHAVLIRDHIARLHPKVVLLLVGANEVGNDFFENADDAEIIRGRLRFYSLSAFVKSLAAYSEIAALSLNLYRYQRARMLGLPHQRVDLKSVETRSYPEPELAQVLNEHREKFLPPYAGRLRDLIAETRRGSLTPVLITQPLMVGDGIDQRTGIDLNAVVMNQYVGHTNWAIMQLYNDVTRRVASEENVFLIDLAVKLPKSSTLFYDFHHYTNAGSEATAAIIAEELRPYLEKQFPEFLKGRK